MSEEQRIKANGIAHALATGALEGYKPTSADMAMYQRLIDGEDVDKLIAESIREFSVMQQEKTAA